MDELRGREQGGRQAVAEELDRGDQHPGRQDAAGDHDAGDFRADDVADADELGGHLAADRGSLEEVEHALGRVVPELEAAHEDLIDRGDAEAREHRPGAGAALLADDQDVRAGGAFRVGQDAVLLDDERAPQRDHHEHAEQAAERGDDQHPCRVHLVAEDHQGGHRDADAERDGLAGRADGLDHVVLEDRRPPRARQLREETEERDGQDGDRDRGRHRHADLQHEVERRGPEDDAEERAHDDRGPSVLLHDRLVGDVGLMGGGHVFLGSGFQFCQILFAPSRAAGHMATRAAALGASLKGSTSQAASWPGLAGMRSWSLIRHESRR